MEYNGYEFLSGNGETYGFYGFRLSEKMLKLVAWDIAPQ